MGGVQFAQVENVSDMFVCVRTKFNNTSGKDKRKKIVFGFVLMEQRRACVCACVRTRDWFVCVYIKKYQHGDAGSEAEEVLIVGAAGGG